jgi:hypothetical protein
MWAIVVEEAAVGFAHAVVAPIERMDHPLHSLD